MAFQTVSNKCQCRSTVGAAAHCLARHLFAAALFASVVALATSAPTISESDGSQTRSLSAGLGSGPSSISTPLSPAHTPFLTASTSSSASLAGGPSRSHLVKRSAPAPYSGHSIMRFGRAAHSIMHFGKRSNEQLEENVANEPLSDAQRQMADNQEYDDALGAAGDYAISAAAFKQFPMISDGVNRFLLVPVGGGSKAFGNKRAKFQDSEAPAVGRDNVFMHFG